MFTYQHSRILVFSFSLVFALLSLAFAKVAVNPANSVMYSTWQGTSTDDHYTNNGVIMFEVDMTQGGSDTFINNSIVGNTIQMGSSDGNSVTNMGEVSYILFLSGNNNTIYNGKSAYVEQSIGAMNLVAGESGGASITTNYGTLLQARGSCNTARRTSGGGNTINNYGKIETITGSFNDGTYSSGGSNTILNTLYADSISGSQNDGTSSSGGSNSITNSGTTATYLIGSYNQGSNTSGGSNTISNSGSAETLLAGSYNVGQGSDGGSNSIESKEKADIVVGTYNEGDQTSGGGNTVSNSGSVSDVLLGSMNAGQGSTGGSNTVINSGSVNGNIYGSYNKGTWSSGSGNTVTNSGTVQGSIYGSCNTGSWSSGAGNTIDNSGIVGIDIYGSYYDTNGSSDSGNTIINSGIVIGGIYSGPGNDSVTIKNDSLVYEYVDGELGTDTLNFTDVPEIEGDQYLNFELMTLSGSGSYLINTMDIATSSTLNGSLCVNGVLNSPSVIVASGGSLGGTGTVNGNVTNYGSIAPGNSIGTLTVNGNVTFASGSSYAVELGHNGTSDKLVSTGAITLDNATLRLTFYDRTRLYRGSDAMEILEAANGIQGTFDDVVFTANTITHSITYLANSIEVEFTRISYSELAATPVQRTMALALDSLLNSASGGMLALLLSLDYDYTLLELQQTLERISPEVYFGYLDSAQQTALLLGNQIIDRAAYLRDLKRGDASSSQAGSQGLNAGAPISADSQWTAWMRGIGGWSHSGARDGYMAYSAGTTGLLIGVDGPLTSWLTAGINYAYTNTDLNWSRDGLRGNQYGNHAGAFVSADFKGFYADASLGFGFLKSKGRRDITLPNQSTSAHADFDTITWLTQVNIGYDFEFNDFSLGPFAAIQHLALHQDSFTETDAGYLNLHVDDVNQSRTSSTFGGRLAYTLDLGNVQLIARAKAGWRHRLDNERTDLDAYFQDYADNAFTLTGLEPQSDALVLQTGVTLLGGEHFMASMDYTLGHGTRDTTHSLGLSLGVRF